MGKRVLTMEEWLEGKRRGMRERYRRRVEAAGKEYKARGEPRSPEERREREREYQREYYRRRRLSDPGWRRKSKEG